MNYRHILAIILAPLAGFLLASWAAFILLFIKLSSWQGSLEGEGLLPVIFIILFIMAVLFIVSYVVQLILFEPVYFLLIKYKKYDIKYYLVLIGVLLGLVIVLNLLNFDLIEMRNSCFILTCYFVPNILLYYYIRIRAFRLH